MITLSHTREHVERIVVLLEALIVLETRVLDANVDLREFQSVVRCAQSRSFIDADEVTAYFTDFFQ